MSAHPTVRTLVLLSAILAVAALVLLAASVSDLEFSAGYRLAPRSAGGTGFTIPQDLLDALLGVLFLVAPILMLVAVLYALAASGFRARALLWFIWVALMIAAMYGALRLYPMLFPRSTLVVGPRDLAVATPAATVVAEDVGTLEVNAPEWVEPVAVVGIALLISVVITAGLWALARRLTRQPGPIDDLAGEARRALDALRAGADVRDTVMRCYFEMGRVLDEHHGLVRKEAMTPREFEQLLVGVDLPRAHVEQLTRLFEMVRYGSHAATEAEEQQAIACLTAVASTREPDRLTPVGSPL